MLRKLSIQAKVDNLVITETKADSTFRLNKFENSTLLKTLQVWQKYIKVGLGNASPLSC